MIKKYWIMTTEYPPFYGGGIGTYCYHTAKMLSERGIEVCVFVPDAGLEEEIKEELKENIRVIRFKSDNQPYYQYLGHLFALSYQFSEIIKKYAEKEGVPDICEAQEYLGIAYYVLQRKYAMEKPFKELKVVITLHTPKFICDYYDEAPSYKFPDYFVGEAEKWCIKSADGVISPSFHLVSELRKWKGLEGVHAEVIRNPYEISQLWNETRLKRHITFVGRLEVRKGIFELLKYFEALWKDGFNAPLYLIGGDTFFHPKGKWCSELIEDKYKFYLEEGYLVLEGKIKPQQLKERLSKRTKISIIPSLIENFPYTMLESIETGAIVLLSDRVGGAEILEDGKSGFIFSHNLSSFKEKLFYILRLEDRELNLIRKEALESVKKACSYEVVFNHKMEYLTKVLEKSLRRHYPVIIEIPQKGELPCNKALEKDLLSVVIPYYNLGELLLETIESVERATYPYKEIIVVNDGSNEPESLRVLEKIEKQGYIKVVHKSNEGLALARNTGAIHARGEFLAFLDADDLVDENYFEWAISILKEYENVSYVGCWVKYFEGASGVWPTFPPEFPYFLFHNSINSSGLVLKTADFLQFGLNDPEMKYGMEDYAFVINMLKHGKRGFIIPHPFHFYRVRRESMLRQFNPYTYLYLYRKLTEKHSELYQAYGVELFNLQNANGPGFMSDNPTWESRLYGYLNFQRKEERTSEEILIPEEVKTLLRKLWQRKLIRKITKLFIRLIK